MKTNYSYLSDGAKASVLNASGKEGYDSAFGIALDDLGARLFDRTAWTSIDPLAEKYYSLSPYAYCAGNPVSFVDPEGKEKLRGFAIGIGTSDKEKHKDELLLQAFHSYPENEGVIHIFAHGSSDSITLRNGETKIQTSEPGDIIDFLNANSKEWNDNSKGYGMIIVFHCCQLGKGENSFAQAISSSFAGDLIVAPNGNVSTVNGREIGATVHSSKDDIEYADWIIFKNGRQVNAFSGKSMPIFKNPEAVFKQYENK